jgi:hypothetical protein
MLHLINASFSGGAVLGTSCRSLTHSNVGPPPFVANVAALKSFLNLLWQLPVS